MEDVERILSELDKALAFYTRFYRIGGPAEMSICLERENNKWLVYSYEHGQRFSVEPFDELTDAIRRLVHLVCREDEEEVLKKLFK